MNRGRTTGAIAVNMGSSTFHTPEDIHDAVESLQLVHGRDRAWIYWLCLFVAGVCTVSVPLVKVDLSVGGQGQVRPAIERISVYPAVDGYIRQILVTDNQAVKKGELLLEIDAPVVDARIVQNRRQREENQAGLADLVLLLQRSSVAAVRAALGLDGPAAEHPAGSAGLLAGRLVTANYLRQYALFESELQRSLLQRGKAQQDNSRNAALYERHLISDQDFDQQRFALVSTERDIDLLIEQTLSRWEGDKIDRELKQIDLESEARQLAKQKELYSLRAPTDGVALGFAGLNADVYVPVAQRLGEISPTDRLQADVFISPRDIGFVHAGQPVTVQVDAFPYTEWGAIKGRVRNVSQDFIQVGAQLAFKAVIDLEATRLRSSAGTTVDLRRGMTVNARFIVKQQSLFNLLFGKMSEALDPTARAAGE